MAAGNILYDNLMKEISLTEDPSSIRAYSSITEAKYRYDLTIEIDRY